MTLRLRGPSGELGLLKERRPYLDRVYFARKLSLHNAIHRHGGPVAPLLHGTAAPLPLRSADGREFELQEFIAGRQPDRASEADLSVLARTVARFHQTAAVARVSWPAAGLLGRSLADRALEYRPYLQHFLGDAFRDAAGEIYAALEGSLEVIASDPSIRSQLVHGDPDPLNAVIRRGEGFLVDLDDLHVGSPLEDLAWLLLVTCGMSDSAGPVPARFRRGWAVDRLVTGVRSYRESLPSPPPPDLLRPWLVIAIACGIVEYYFNGSCRLSRGDLLVECAKAKGLLSSLPSVLGA